jgi:hypothetical protein
VVGSFTLLDVKLEKRIKGSLPIEEAPWQVGLLLGVVDRGRAALQKSCLLKRTFVPSSITAKVSWMIFPLDCRLGKLLRHCQA